ncbi:MAG: hypothetical protein U1E76_25065, partial [Planctomycetota bacterium]
ERRGRVRQDDDTARARDPARVGMRDFGCCSPPQLASKAVRLHRILTATAIKPATLRRERASIARQWQTAMSCIAREFVEALRT